MLYPNRVGDEEEAHVGDSVFPVSLVPSPHSKRREAPEPIEDIIPNAGGSKGRKILPDPYFVDDGHLSAPSRAGR